MLRALRRALFAAIASLVAVVATVLILAATAPGSRWLIRQAQVMAPGTLQIASIHGVLLSDITLGDVHYQHGAERMAIQRLHLRWRAAALLHGTLHIEDLDLSGVRYRAALQPSSTKTTNMPAVHLPVRIRLDRAVLTDVRIEQGTTPREIRRIALSARLGDGTLDLEHLELAAAGFHIEGHGQLAYEPPYAGTLHFAWRRADTAAEPLAGRLQLHGNQHRIEIEQTLTAPFPVVTRGSITPNGKATRLDLHGEWERLHWPLTGTPKYRSAQGHYRIAGTLAELEVDLSGDVSDSTLPVEHLTLALSGGAKPEAPYPFSFKLDWSARLTGKRTAAGVVRLAGDRERVRIEQQVERPFKLSTRGDVELAGTRSHVDLQGQWEELEWPLVGTPTFASRSGHYHIRGDLSDLHLTFGGAVQSGALPVTSVDVQLTGGAEPQRPYPFHVRLAWSAQLAGGTEARGDGELHGNLHEVHIAQQLTAPFRLTSSGNVDLSGALPKLNLHGEWQGLSWPLAGPVRYQSDEGRYTIAGTTAAYELQLQGSFAQENVAKGRAIFDASGSRDGLDIERLQLESDAGDLRAHGHLAWKPARTWDLVISGKNLDPGVWRPDLQGKVDIEAKSTGSLQGGLRGQLDLERLQGTLRGNALRASGKLAYVDGRVRAQPLDVRSGRNQVHIEGDLTSQRVDARFKIDAPELSDLWPGLAGRLDGNGSLAGALRDPRVHLQLAGERLTFGQYKLKQISATVQLDPDNAAASRARIEARDVVIGARTVDELRIDGTGNLARHRLQLQLRSRYAEVQLTAAGHLRGGSWNGTLQDARIEAHAGGTWNLERPVDLAIGARSMRASRACWQRQQAHVCAGGSWKAGGSVSAQLEIHELPLDLVQTLLPRDMQVQGLVNAKATIEGKASAPRIQVQISPEPGKLSFKQLEGKPLEARYHDASIRADYGPGGLHLDLALAIGKDGGVRARLDVGPGGEWRGRKLAADVRLHFPDIAVLAAAVPRLTDVKGAFELEARASGTVGTPHLTAQAHIRDAQALLPGLGIHLQKVNLSVHNSGGDRLLIAGSLTSGPGELKLDGEVRADPAAGWPLKLHIKGEKFEAANMPEAKVLVSPDLDVSLVRRDVEVRGSVTIPEAQIHIRQLPASAVQVSADQVIVGAGGAKPKPAASSPWNIHSHVRVVLGDKVHFSGFGLTADLQGSITATTKPEKQPLAEGTLKVVNGRYRAYGQDLTIEQGLVIFSGPVSNPNLNVRAVRKIGTTTVGIDLTGSVKSPHSQLFSSPAMSDAETLSYLLTGNPLGSNSGQSAQILTQAALSLGVQGTQPVTQEIQKALGLSELTIGSSGPSSSASAGTLPSLSPSAAPTSTSATSGLQESSLLIGKYLTPDLYVRYALGLFSSTGTLRLTYRLTKHFSLEAESGAAQGVDATYTIEFNKLF